MGEPVVTRAVLRRNLGRMANMKFFKLYPEGYITLGDANTVTKITDSNLTQEDNFWKGHYAYIVGSKDERRIASFRSNDDAILPEYEFGAFDTTVADQLEIYSKWPASALHDAINRSIREGSKYWPDVAKFEDMIVQEYKMAYDISSDGVDPTIWRLDQVWVERSISSMTGTVDTAVDSATVQFESGIATSDIDTDWYFSIYYGKCRGHVAPVTAVDTTTNRITWATTSDQASDTGADSTSKFRLWNANKQYLDWYPLDNYRMDAVEYPNVMYLANALPSVYGYRFRFIYRSLENGLDSDDQTTVVPQDYIMYRAMALLHDMPMSDNKADVRQHQQMADYYDRLADMYAQKHRKRTPQVQLRVEGMETGLSSYQSDSIGYPLRWGG